MRQKARRGLVPSDSTKKYEIFKPPLEQKPLPSEDALRDSSRRRELLEQIQLERELWRRKYRGDLFLFAKEVCGYIDMDRDVHGELCTRLMDAYWGRGKYVEEIDEKVGSAIRRYLFLLPRGTFKTSIATVAFPIWILLQNDPPIPGTSDRRGWDPPYSFNGKMGYDQRILIGSEVDAHAIRFVDNIKDHITRNEEIHELYGNLCPEKRAEGLWTKQRSNVTWRMDYRHKEANLTTTSLDSAVNSGHFDFAIIDDLISEKQVTNKEQIDQTINWYKRLMPLMKCPHPTVVIFIGTRWDDKDLYGHFQEDEAELGKWIIYRESAERDEEEIAAGKPRLFFPALLDDAALADLRDTLGPYLFSCLYLNDPIDKASALFKPAFFDKNYFIMPAGDHLERFLAGLSIFVTVDPATSPEKLGCYRVVCTWGWSHRGVGYLLELWRDREAGPGVWIWEAFKQYQRWNALIVGMEQLPMFQFSCDQISEQTGIWPPWEELKASKRKKPIRIMGLQPLAATNRLKLQRHPVHGMSGALFEEEALRFPRGRTQDTLDASAYQLDLAFRGKVPDSAPAEKGTQAYTEAFYHELHQRKLDRLQIGAHSADGNEDWYNDM